MLIDRLDRTQWRLSQAIDHVTTQIERAVARGERTPLPDPTLPPWRQAENPRASAASQAAREVRQVGPGKEGAKGSFTIYRVSA